MPRAKNWSAVILIAFSISLQCADPVIAAAPQKVVRLKVGYASITGGRISLWAAHDMEFFARHGLETELIFIASSSHGVPALLAGEIPIYSGSPETASSSRRGGRRCCHHRQ